MAGNILNLDAAGFDAAVREGVTLVDFWAPWCGPCRLQGPILEQVAEAVGARAKVAKVNVDEQPDLASRFDISGIPTLVILKNGAEIDRLNGVHQKDDLLAALAKHS